MMKATHKTPWVKKTKSKATVDIHRYLHLKPSTIKAIKDALKLEKDIVTLSLNEFRCVT